MSEKFLYREEDHTYWELGKDGEYFLIPGVTSIISKILNYSNVPNEILDAAKQRGNNIHDTIKLWHAGTLDESTLAEGNKIALASYLEWLRNDSIKYDGLIVDIKTRKPYMPYDSGQLSGYDILLEKQGLNIGQITHEFPFFHSRLHFGGTPDYVKYNPIYMHKMILYLKPEGGYEFVPGNRKQSGSMFRKLLKHWWDCQKIEQLVERWKR